MKGGERGKGKGERREGKGGRGKAREYIGGVAARRR